MVGSLLIESSNDDLVKSLKRSISIIPAKFSMTGSTPANNENPPSPPFSKGGLGGI